MNPESLRVWLESYRRAWEGRDAEAVGELFTEDAAGLCKELREWWVRKDH